MSFSCWNIAHKFRALVQSAASPFGEGEGLAGGAITAIGDAIANVATLTGAGAAAIAVVGSVADLASSAPSPAATTATAATAANEGGDHASEEGEEVVGKPVEQAVEVDAPVPMALEGGEAGDEAAAVTEQAAAAADTATEMAAVSETAMATSSAAAAATTANDAPCVTPPPKAHGRFGSNVSVDRETQLLPTEMFGIAYKFYEAGVLASGLESRNDMVSRNGSSVTYVG